MVGFERGTQMEITEVHVRLVQNREDRLKAYCSMTIDNEFVIRDIKIIQGTDGYFVAMPCRKITDHCDHCGVKNHLRAAYCNGCGRQLPEDRTRTRGKGRPKLHADVAHPINNKCRRSIQEKLVRAFRAELRKSKKPGYKPAQMDDSQDDVFDAV